MVKMVIDRLFSVKSFVTIMMAYTFTKLALVGGISGEQFLTIFTVVIGFYFGTQAEKRRKDGKQ